MNKVNYEQKALEKCQELIDYIKENGKFPSLYTKSNSYTLAVWYSQIRYAKTGKGKYKFYQSLQELAEQNGMPDLFNEILDNYEQTALDKCKQCIEFYKTNGRYPSNYSNDKYESELAQWLNHSRRAKMNKKGRNKFYPSVEQLAISEGLTDMFNPIDTLQISLDRCKQVIMFAKTHGHYPKTSDPNNYSMAKWLQNKRHKPPTQYHKQLQEYAKSQGFPNIFTNKWKLDFKKPD